ncbi:MAG: hypothetical protein HKN74_03180 [Acidimicrobiia bacterium]|nr:hypothetical protein [Acidimicrobiia bacterium]NNF09267.1 hypothetical protein [Acidimicrobiia bacterium]
MRITSAMLADSAQVHGGKLFVLGGGFDTIRTRSVPAVHKALTVVMVAEIDPGERETNLSIEVTLMNEDMQALGPRASGTLRVGEAPAHRPGQRSVVPLAIPFFDLRFPAEQGYVFRVSHQDTELTRIPFSVLVVPQNPT